MMDKLWTEKASLEQELTNLSNWEDLSEHRWPSSASS